MNPTELIHNEDDIQLYDYYVDELGNEGVVVYISNDSTNVMVLSSDEGTQTIDQTIRGNQCYFFMGDFPGREAIEKEKTEAIELIEKKNKLRSNYYNFYTDKEWGYSASYDLCIDSSKLSSEQVADIIIEYVKKRIS